MSFEFIQEYWIWLFFTTVMVRNLIVSFSELGIAIIKNEKKTWWLYITNAIMDVIVVIGTYHLALYK